MANIKVALNADMGESFGLYKMGNDEALMEYVTTTNLACGFHAADPMVMQESVRLAKKHNVSVGAHPGFKDLQGFGRRMLRLSPEELYADTLYQFGALDAFLKVEGMELTHVCPHGLLDPLISNEEVYGLAFIKAMKDYKSDMKLIAESKSLVASLCEKEGIEVAHVGYPDLDYNNEGNIVISRDKKPLDAELISKQAVRMVKDGKLLSTEGKEFSVKVKVLTFHGDVPNIVEIMQEVHRKLKESKIEIIRF
jgi:UPF0271 protein